MEKKSVNWNTIIGLLLISGIFIAYNFLSTPPPPEEPGQGGDTTKLAESAKPAPEAAEYPDTTAQLDSLQMVGPFVGATADAQTEFKLSNERLALRFSAKGGQIISARLKNYQTYDSLPLMLIDKSSAFNIPLNVKGETINSAQLHFALVESKPNSLVLQASTPEGNYLRYTYSLEPDNFMLSWRVSSRGLGDYVTDNSKLEWNMITLRHEKNLETEGQKTNIEYWEAEDEDLESLSAAGEDEESSKGVRWVAVKQQFFSSILYNRDGNFPQALMRSAERAGDSSFTKEFYTLVEVSNPGTELDSDLGLYLGPNKYEVMAAYEQNFERVIPLGWGILGWINRGLVINLFNWLDGYGLNYGLIILIIALVIKILIFPLTFTSYKSMAKMRVLKPEVDALNEKYKDKDAMAKQQAMMELYRKAGVNPLGGCIPILLQMPILIALFNFFPSSIELRQESFLWAHDLSTYDSIYDLPFNIPFYGDHISLFTLLMTVSTLLYTWMNQQVTGQNQQYPQMKYLVYLMPIVFLGVFNNYAAGLSYYYFLANMITFGQQFAIRAYIDEDKIHAKMQEKKENPVKENRFMRRMREMQEQQKNSKR